MEEKQKKERKFLKVLKVIGCVAVAAGVGYLVGKHAKSNHKAEVTTEAVPGRKRYYYNNSYYNYRSRWYGDRNDTGKNINK